MRIGIVSMMKNPMGFETWLRYHRKCGIFKFYLRIEDSDHLKKISNHSSWHACIYAEYTTGEQNYAHIMIRQLSFIKKIISIAKKDGCTHLLHIDDDELLYCPDGSEKFELFLNTSPQTASCISLTNYEAVFKKTMSEDIFDARYFRTNPTTYTSYVNGKSMGVLAHSDVYPLGPHRFSGEEVKVPAKIAVILHYESACFFRWKRKFEEYSKKATDVDVQRIPFIFYRESIHGVRNHSDMNVLYAIWKKWKVVKSITDQEKKRGLVYIKVKHI